MKITKKNELFYITHSFRKLGKVSYKEKLLGRKIPKDIEEMKETFFRECLQEDVFKKLKIIQHNFRNEWKMYPESVKKKIILDLAIEFTYNTNAIEGSTITLDETEELIKRRISPHRPLEDVQETINHVHVFMDVINKKEEITEKTILDWHLRLFKETKSDIAGKIRDYHVRVGDYRCPDWQDVPKLMEEFFSWYQKNNALLNPVELAARAHYKFEQIHPFGDGNGRVGRLLIASILKKGMYPLLVIEYKRRKSYYNAFRKNENGFLQYFLRRYLNNFKEYLKL